MLYLRKKLNDYPKNIWLISTSVLIPALYTLLNRYFIGYMGIDSIIVEQSYEALEVIIEVFLEMLPLVVIATTSQHYKDKDIIRSIVKNVIIFQLIITVSFSLVMIFGASSFIDLINTPSSSKTLALSYFRLKTLILPIQSLWLILSISIKSFSPKKSIFLTFGNVAINYVLDCLLISNFSFSLKLGLLGVALSGILTNLITLGIAILIFKKEIGFGVDFFNFKTDTNVIKVIINIGKYTGLESLVRNIGYILGVVAIINLITDTNLIVAYNTVNSVFWSIILVPVLALTDATKYAIGNSYGDKNYHKISSIISTTTILLSIWLALCLVFGQYLIPSVTQWLTNDTYSPSLMHSIKKTFNILMLAYTIFSFNCILNSYFYGIGVAAPLFKVSFYINVLIYIPMGLLCKIGALKLSYTAVLWSTVIIYLLNLFFTYMYFRDNHKKLSIH